MYEISPYYDKKSKIIRHRSKYIGPVKNGNLVEKPSLPKTTYEYGSLLPLFKIVDDLSIKVKLDQIVGEDSATKILILAMNKILRQNSLDNIKEWYEDTYLCKLYPDLGLSSASLSEFLYRIGKSDIIDKFTEKLVNSLKIKDTVYFDLTSFSSQSKNIKYLEYGYSRDDDDLPQVNVSLAASKEEGIPINYAMHPGSVVDLTTLENAMNKYEAMGIKEILFILDRGFFTKPNLKRLLDSSYEFIIGASYTFKEIKHQALMAKKDIEDARQMLRIENNIIFYNSAKLSIYDQDLSVYIYYDLGREKDEKERFYLTLEERMGQLKQRKIWRYEQPEEIAKEVMGEYYKYINWSYNTSFEVTPKENAISQRLNRCGITILGYKGNYKPEEVLIRYRARDEIEKMFLSLKSYVGAKPMRVQSKETLNSLLFVNFIALILRHKLLKMMLDSGLTKKYSAEKLFLELSKIRKIVLANGKEIVSEITKKQREIMESLNVAIDYVPKNPRV